MKLISDVINELTELKEEYGNLEVVTDQNEEPSFEYNDDDDGDDVIVVS